MKKYNAIFLSFLMLFSSLSFADNLPTKPHISVSGDAKIKVAPDTVKISFQVVSVENDAEHAKQVVDQQVNEILSLLDKNNFDENLLTRADLQLRPEYEYIEKKRVQIGIKATRSLSYQLNALNETNAFLQLLVKAKVSNIGQIQYALQNPEEWQLKARHLAVKNSVEKAKGLAESYGVSLGDVYSINYQTSNAHVQPVLMKAMENDSVGNTYQNNEITIQDRVSAVFLLN